jgi:lysophospholipase L1-like esterase
LGNWSKLVNSTTVLTANKWTGKTWNAIGDSITEKNLRTNKNYHDYIKDTINCTVNNYGLSGTGWFTFWNNVSEGVTNQPFYNRLDALDLNADLITVFGGTNDVAGTGKQLVLGTFGDTDPVVSFYGAVDYTLKGLINKYPTRTIATFTPLPSASGTRWGETATNMVAVVDAILKVSKHYSIPCLDLYRTSNLYPWNDEANAYYFSPPSGAIGDRLHPNDNGHKKIADKILLFLNGL